MFSFYFLVRSNKVCHKVHITFMLKHTRLNTLSSLSLSLFFSGNGFNEVENLFKTHVALERDRRSDKLNNGWTQKEACKSDSWKKRATISQS